MIRRSVILLATFSAVWCVAAWLVSGWFVRERTAALIAQQSAEVRVAAATITDNFERVLYRLHGLPAVLASGSDAKAALASFGPAAAPSRLSREARKAAWGRRPELAALNRQLLAVAGNMDVDIIWVMDAAGDCVAASNSAEATSFIGTNYADRSYFKAAQAGGNGQQYAIGRVTGVPGLFLSAPVMANGQFLGAVAIKIDLPRLAPWVQYPGAFVTDEYGVIILAADRALEMRAVPGATVHDLPVEARRERYRSETFEPLGVTIGANGLATVNGTPLPHVAARSERLEHGLTVQIIAPVKDIDRLRGDGRAVFLLLALSGILLTTLVFGVRTYLSGVRQHRQSMEATNASLSALNAHLNRLATTDSLTDVANRLHFRSLLEAELARSKRYGHACSLLAADLDHFKRINDRYGHSGGDEALRHFVRVARRELRGQDQIGRLGGEEFAVLLPETALESALAVAERIRSAVESEPAAFENEAVPLTASFGVACAESSDESAEALLQRADKAAYAAKESGRNRVVCAPPAPSPSVPTAPDAAAAP